MNSTPGPAAAHVPDDDPAPAPPAEGFRSPANTGYEEVSLVDTPNGPRFDGPVPDRIGVTPHMIATLPPFVGEFTRNTDTLRLLDVAYRQVGWDGQIHVFERVRQ
jgi:hypothetical protein